MDEESAIFEYNPDDISNKENVEAALQSAVDNSKPKVLLSNRFWISAIENEPRDKKLSESEKRKPIKQKFKAFIK